LEESKYKTIKDFYDQYAVLNESNFFKIKISLGNDFNYLRSLHPERRDLTSFAN
jgi:hypothetical protein